MDEEEMEKKKYKCHKLMEFVYGIGGRVHWEDELLPNLGNIHSFLKPQKSAGRRINKKPQLAGEHGSSGRAPA
jgi:hypothetical protein